MNRSSVTAALVATAFFASPVLAEDTIKVPNIIELSGGGATVGTNWKNGASMAVEEINAAGGILGKKLEMEFIDTASDPGKARAGIQRALDEKPVAIFGPIYSGSVAAVESLTNDAGIPEIMGGEAGPLTAQGSKYLFRTSFGQNTSMPKIGAYLQNVAKVKSIAIIYVNNDFGKGGRDALIKDLGTRGIKVAADLSSEAGQADFAADVVKIKGSGADSIFAYVNEEESARFLIEVKKQDVKLPIFGETTILGQKVIDLAKGAANGVKGHVGLSVDAPEALVQAFGKKFEAKYKYKSDHNGMKGYIAPYMLKAAAEKAGKLEPKAIAAALHGLTISPSKYPGILLEATWDENGDINRQSYLAEVKDGKQVITETLPMLKK